MLDKDVLARNFSKSAYRYDEYADIQRLAAGRLIEEIPEGRFDHILEIGCGTGIYTRLLNMRFGYSNIRAIDISRGMLEIAREKIQARNVLFEVQDAEKILLEEEYGLITSNSAIHWFGSIEKALQRYSNFLKKGGWLVFSSFGPMTFTELAASLRKIRKEDDLSLASMNFLGKEELKRILARFLTKVSVKEILMQREYPSLTHLLKEIRYTGSRGYSAGTSHIWTQGLLDAVEDAYLNDAGRIIATYQIFLCRAVK